MSTITEIIRLAVLMGCILRITTSYGQTSLKKINLDLGNYSVGFKHYVVFDRTRTYSRIYDYKNQKIPRPIPTSMWFPSQENVEGKKRLKILDYLEILKEEEEWEHLPNDQILNWFYYATTLDNQDHLKEKKQPSLGWNLLLADFLLLFTHQVIRPLQ